MRLSRLYILVSGIINLLIIIMKIYLIYNTCDIVQHKDTIVTQLWSAMRFSLITAAYFILSTWLSATFPYPLFLAHG